MTTASEHGRPPDSRAVLAGVARALAEGEPGVWRRLLDEHVADESGRCDSCHTHGIGRPRWPCTLRTVAEAARDIAGRSGARLP